MSWFRRSRRPAYAVDGVEPRHSDDWDHYDGDTLAGQPRVAEAVTRLPQDPALTYLLYSLGVGTPDGQEWTLSFGDESLIHFDLSYPGTDIFEEALAAAPFTVTVERIDREIFLFTTAELLAVDVVLANVLDVCGEVFRRLNSPST